MFQIGTGGSPQTSGPKHHRALWFVREGLLEGITTFVELEARISHLPVEDRGPAFEIFGEAYCATSPLLRATNVWPLQAAPGFLLRLVGLKIHDIGVDALVETLDSDLPDAVQFKFRSVRDTKLSWDELSTFTGATDRVNRRVLITNVTSFSDVMDDRPNFFAILGNHLDLLTPSQFDVMRGWLESVDVPLVPRNPLPHQGVALSAIVPALEERGSRTQAIMACATGKTLVAFWAAKRLKSETTLVLLPSLPLVSQTIYEWFSEISEKSLDYICVCSDATVERKIDSIIVKAVELGCRVTTDPEVVRRFLSRPGPKVVFSTYQSAEVVAQGMPKGTAFDLGIFDEAHRTVGRKDGLFGFAMDDQRLKIHRRLFMTATKRNVRPHGTYSKPIPYYSMDREEDYGKVSHSLSSKKAIELGLIVPIKKVIAFVTSTELRARLGSNVDISVDGLEVRARHVANQIAVMKAAKQFGFKKTIIFNRSVDMAKKFVAYGGDPREGLG